MHAYVFMKGHRRPARAATSSLALGLLAALCACDPQASPLFRGVPLLTVNGSVSIAENHTRGKLQPALAFVNRRTGEMQILEVACGGDSHPTFASTCFHHRMTTCSRSGKASRVSNPSDSR